MRLLYIDLDSQRPDHLGCYGYARNTSPNVDQVAARGVRFNSCYATDVPCLPSRTALFSGRCGFHTGVVNHGGTAADMHLEGPSREFHSTLGRTSWMACLRRAGLSTTTISPFGERHSAWHWYANFNEVFNTGKGGMERADEVEPVALDWLGRNGARDNWFLHLNLWDAHTPYRTPPNFGNPFENEPIPAWLSEDVRQKHWNGCGPHSAREVLGYGLGLFGCDEPRQPEEMRDMEQVRAMFDGYDCGVRYADDTVGRVLNRLADLGVLDETAIIISADHGENLGELNIYGDHQTADEFTSHVPLIVSWPGVTEKFAGQRREMLVQHLDFAATSIELLGEAVPANWDGVSFAPQLRSGEDAGREFCAMSQGAWACQRGVRWNEGDKKWILVRSYHEGHHGFPDVMLFELHSDPHEQHDLANEKPEIARYGLSLLEKWRGQMMETATHPSDPLQTVMLEGGPLHTRGQLPAYCERLRQTQRQQWANWLENRYPNEV